MDGLLSLVSAKSEYFENLAAAHIDARDISDVDKLKNEIVKLLDGHAHSRETFVCEIKNLNLKMDNLTDIKSVFKEEFENFGILKMENESKEQHPMVDFGGCGILNEMKKMRMEFEKSYALSREEFDFMKMKMDSVAMAATYAEFGNFSGCGGGLFNTKPTVKAPEVSPEERRKKTQRDREEIQRLRQEAERSKKKNGKNGKGKKKRRK